MAQTNYTKLAKELLEECFLSGGVPTLQYAHEQFWQWDGCIYKPLKPIALRDRCQLWLRAEVRNLQSTRTRDAVVEHIRATVRFRATQDPPCWRGAFRDNERYNMWIGFKNGVLDLTYYLKTGKYNFVKCNPRWFATDCLPFDFDPNARCPLWDRCIGEWTSQNYSKAAILQEFSGYCLWPDCRYNKALFLEGDGGNGKNVFLETLQKVLGESNCSAVNITIFGTRFGLEDTIGKRLNVCSETPKKTRLPVETINAFVSGDSITMTRKHKSGWKERNRCKLIVAWNHRPKVDDTSHGLWRRTLLVGFHNNFRDNADIDLPWKLQEELPGIFLWVLRGLKILDSNKKFSKSQEVDSLTSSFRDESDHVRKWIGEELYWIEDKELGKRIAYNDYREWAEDRGFVPVEQVEFSKRVIQAFPNVRHRRMTASRTPYYVGIQLRRISRLISNVKTNKVEK